MIVGLGNPGERYAATKHNMGFMALDILAQRVGVSFSMDKTFQAEIAEFFQNGEKIFLVKPQTFMNESGRAVKPLLTYFNIDLSDLLVLVDDMDSVVGRVRFRKKGSSGGQRGIKSLIIHLGTEDWKRLKIGIGRPKAGWTVVNHVLSQFDEGEIEEARQGLQKSVDAVEYYIQTADFEKTMSKYNG